MVNNAALRLSCSCIADGFETSFQGHSQLLLVHSVAVVGVHEALYVVHPLHIGYAGVCQAGIREGDELHHARTGRQEVHEEFSCSVRRHHDARPGEEADLVWQRGQVVVRVHMEGQPPSGGEGPHRALHLHVVRDRSGTGAADQNDAVPFCGIIRGSAGVQHCHAILKPLQLTVERSAASAHLRHVEFFGGDHGVVDDSAGIYA